MANYKREQKWEQKYMVPTRESGWVERIVYPNTPEQRDRNAIRIRELGYRPVSCKKLYPFSMERNGHNIDLINTLCANRLHDWYMGDLEISGDEAEALEALKRETEAYLSGADQIVWVPWDTHKRLTELSAMAVEHRANACIEAGRPDLVKYC